MQPLSILIFSILVNYFYILIRSNWTELKQPKCGIAKNASKSQTVLWNKNILLYAVTLQKISTPQISVFCNWVAFLLSFLVLVPTILFYLVEFSRAFMSLSSQSSRSWMKVGRSLECHSVPEHSWSILVVAGQPTSFGP